MESIRGLGIQQSSMVQDDIDLESYIIKANFNNVNFVYFDEL